MTEDTLEQRMERLEQQLESGLDELRKEMRSGFAKLDRVLLGDYGSEPQFVRREEFRTLRAQVEANTAWRQRVTWMIAGAAAAGGLTGGGIVAIIMRAVGG